MTPRQAGSTRFPALHLQKNADIQRFADEVKSLDDELQSDATVRFFAEKFGLEAEVITIYKPQTGPIEYQHFLYIGREVSSYFTRYKCAGNGCWSRLYIPNIVQPGQRLAIISRCEHNHSAPAINYGEFGRSIHLNNLFEAIQILQTWGYDMNNAFETGIEKSWILQQIDSDVIEAINTFMEACLLCDSFEESFAEDGSCTLYMRFKCGITDESSFEDFFGNQAYIGWRSRSEGNRLRLERADSNKQRWMKAIKFYAQNSPPNIVGADLLIPTLDLLRNISEGQAKASEALIQELFVKPAGREKLILNEKYDKCPKDYLLDSVENNHKAAAFILLRGIWQANNFRFDDYRPYGRGKPPPVNQAELEKRLRAINRDSSIKNLDNINDTFAFDKLDEITAERDALQEFLRKEGYDFDVSSGAPISKKPRI